MFLNKQLLIFIIPIIFFIVGVYTLYDYGISWDEPLHFERGQAYLHFFLTGKTNFLDLPAYPELIGTSDYIDRKGEDSLYTGTPKGKIAPQPNFRRSYYQSDVITIDNFLSKRDGGHPPASDILSAVFNLIFYQKLDILGDIESYHLYEVFISSILVLAVSLFVFKNFGLVEALISGLSIVLYPLFFAESHFNIKDPTQTTFFSLTIIAFFFAISKKNKPWLIILSAIFAGLALGTKLNALFLSFILGPWLAFKYLFDKTKFDKKIIMNFLIFPILVLVVFFVLWPFLWHNSIQNILRVLDYYHNIGLGYSDQLSKYVIFGFNCYPLIWIFYTTPLPILILSLIGFIYAFYSLFWKKSSLSLLVLLWFLVPIIRVSILGANIYGGVRQIMEYIPAMAILSGIGVHFILSRLKIRYYQLSVFSILVFAFTFVGYEIIKIHPNENVYFNSLIGGLSGAKEKNIPSWGNSYGNAYYQAVQWLNKNAEINAKVGLPISNMTNLPRIKLREDLEFSNSYPSGPKMQKEYVIELSHDWTLRSWYGFAYYDKFLNPVYEVKVDDVAIAKIWKNDLQHTKAELVNERLLAIQSQTINDNQMIVTLQKEASITKLIINHDSFDCNKNQIGGFVRLSIDTLNWTQEPETIDYPQIPVQWLESSEKKFVFLLTGKKAKYILLDTQVKNSCILKNFNVEVYGVIIN